jgi:predicted kinase/diadenosine tetraphosphatase ApaH/serine/threonine PP2A family protein phosphatase
MLCDDPTNQYVSGSAFRLLNWIISERLRFGRTTVVDSTALDRRFRRDMLKLAAEHGSRTLLILFDTAKELSLKRDRERKHSVGEEVIERQHSKLLKSIEEIKYEPWDAVTILHAPDADNTSIVRPVGSFDLRHLHGPFDIIGDIHGCLDELIELLARLGYQQAPDVLMQHPEKRRLVFLGDLADRGPHNTAVFDLVMPLVEAGAALYTPGNHCNMLLRYLLGKKKTLDWGLDKTVQEVEAHEAETPGYKERLRRFIETAPTYAWLDGGELVVAHGGIKEEMIGKENGKIRALVLYGDVTGKTNPDGTPERLDWAKDYHGSAAIVYGHTPVPGPVWRNNTINIDQGCVFGGWLSAVRWPERDTVQVRARKAYFTERMPAFLRDERRTTSGGGNAKAQSMIEPSQISRESGL